MAFAERHSIHSDLNQRYELNHLVLVVTLVLDLGGKMNHKLSSGFESVDFEGAAKLADS